MKNNKICRGCGSKQTIKIFKRLNICQKCLLVFSIYNKSQQKKIKSNIVKSIRYDFFKDSINQFSSTKEFIDEGIIKKGKIIKEGNFNKILKYTSFNNKDLILDFGSGFGPFLEAMKKDYSIIGLEPNKDSYNFSKKLGHKVINKYIKENLFKPKMFKLIFSRTVLTYVLDLKKTFNLFYKFLKDDGYLMLYLHQYKFSKYIHSHEYLDSIIKAEQSIIFSDESIKNLLLFNNFNLIYMNSSINGTFVIAKKSIKKDYKNKKKLYGNVNFEIFYIKYLLIIISKILNLFFNIKKKLINIIKGII